MQTLPKLEVSSRSYISEDYTLLSTWWLAYKDWGTLVPEALLPTDGYIIEVNGKPVAAGFLYIANNSKCAWAEWIVVDPSADKVSRTIGIETLYGVLSDACKAAGQEFLFTCTKHERLMGRLEEMGFMKGDTGMTMMIRRLV